MEDSVLTYIGAEETASSITAFQPSILKDLGWTSTAAQGHTIPVYATAFLLTLTCAWLSDYFQHRYTFTLFGSILIIIGWSIKLAHIKPSGVRNMGMLFVTAGAFIVMSTMVVWLGVNLSKGVKRSVAMGLPRGFGNCGTFVSGSVFIHNQAPRYPVGFGVGLAFGILAGCAATVYSVSLGLKNRRRDRVQSVAFSQSYTRKKMKRLQDLGDAHPDYRFQL